MQRKAWALIFAFALLAVPLPSSANWLDNAVNAVSSGLNTATEATASGLNTATDAVGNGLSSATDAVGNGLSTAVNATADGLSTAANVTGRWINTAVDEVKDVYNVSSSTLQNITSDVRDALSPAADSVKDSAESLGNTIADAATGTYNGVVGIGRNITNGDSDESSSSSESTTTVDTTDVSSIISALTANSTGYIQVANSLLVALGQDQASGIEEAIRNIVNNQTGNTSYPATAVESTVSLALAQAIVTSLITANNYTVTVEYEGNTNTVNASQVANVFIAGLQDGLTPCARNISERIEAESGSPEYFQTVADNCCYLVSQPLTYTEALAQANGVADQVESSLSESQTLGQAPSLDLTRCLSNTTSES